jgi:hypothetical protein
MSVSRVDDAKLEHGMLLVNIILHMGQRDGASAACPGFVPSLSVSISKGFFDIGPGPVYSRKGFRLEIGVLNITRVLIIFVNELGYENKQ